MTIESKRAVAIDNIDVMESLCHTCMYKGCTNCPSLVPVRGGNEEIKSFPQVKKGEKQKNGKIVVESCEWYSRMKKQKAKVKRAQFVWDPRQKKHVRVIK